MRDALEFAQRTSGRGRGKVVLVYPAERMNHVTANALLKTLEEPPGDVRFVLASEAAHQLLPTIRSRCLGHALAWPATAEAVAWLQEQGVPAPTRRCCCGPPAAGRKTPCACTRPGWTRRPGPHWPKALARGDVGAGRLEPAQVVDALQKLCHDLLARALGRAAALLRGGRPAASRLPWPR